MKIIPLAPESRMFHLATHKVIVKAADVAGLGASAGPTALQIFPATGKTVPAGTTVRFAGFNLVTAFDSSTDTGITSLLIEVGDGGDTDRYITSTQIHVDGTEILYQDAKPVTQPYTYLTADGIDALFTAANGGTPLLSEIDSGELEIYLHISRKDDLERAQ